jgi:hypothetical protein
MNQFPPGYGQGRLRPDDEIYRHDKSWLGPTGYTLPFKIPYRALPVAGAVFMPALGVLRLIGIGGLALYAGSLIVSSLAAALVVRVTGPERPVSAMLTIFFHEISAPRPPRGPQEPVTVTLRPGLVPVRDAIGPGRQPRHRQLGGPRKEGDR